MNIAEARSYSDGIEFYVQNKGITISARRKEDGNIEITKDNRMRPMEEIKGKRLFALIVTILFLFIRRITNSSNLIFQMGIVFLFIWCAVFSFYYLRYRSHKNNSTYRYHAAEHKVLNYMDKNNNMTFDCNEVMKMSSISYRCGSTLIAVILIFITMTTFGALLFPWIIVKILWGLISVFITLYLWANGKCNFLQRFVIKNPTRKEMEVAIMGAWEYLKIKNEI